MCKRNLRRRNKIFIAGILTMSILFTNGCYPMAKGQKENKKDVRVQIRKDAEEFSRNEKGDTKYVVHYKNAEDGKAIKKKHKKKLQEENKYVKKYSENNFTMADITSQDVKALQDNDDVIIEKDYLLEGSGTSTENIWQKSMDAVVDSAWDVKAIGAEDKKVKVDKKIKVAVLDSGL